MAQYTPTKWFPNEHSTTYYSAAIFLMLLAGTLFYMVYGDVIKPSALWDPKLMTGIAFVAVFGSGTSVAYATRTPSNVTPAS